MTAVGYYPILTRRLLVEDGFGVIDRAGAVAAVQVALLRDRTRVVTRNDRDRVPVFDRHAGVVVGEWRRADRHLAALEDRRPIADHERAAGTRPHLCICVPGIDLRPRGGDLQLVARVLVTLQDERIGVRSRTRVRRPHQPSAHQEPDAHRHRQDRGRPRHRRGCERRLQCGQPVPLLWNSRDLQHRVLGDAVRRRMGAIGKPGPQQLVELQLGHRALALGHAVHRPTPVRASASRAARRAWRPLDARDFTVPSGTPSMSAICGWPRSR